MNGNKLDPLLARSISLAEELSAEVDLDDVLREAVDLAEEIVAPTDGRDGRDGKDGRDGRDGRDADPAFVERLVLGVLGNMPKPRDGIDADPALIRDEVARAVGALSLRTGDRGPVGPSGPIGPMPAHEWRDDQVRFEIAPGEWGEWSAHLRGPRGYQGPGGGLSNQPTVTKPINSYFPSGWG